MVVVDTFSKYSHFIPICHPFTSLTVAKQFMNDVFKLHEFPQAMISNRDKAIISYPYIISLTVAKQFIPSRLSPATTDLWG